MAAQVELILFAIRGAVRIAEQARRSFADLTRAAEIRLPLPDFPAQPDLATARTFYALGDGKEYLASDVRVRTLHHKFPSVTAAEEREYLGLYREHWSLWRVSKAIPGESLDSDLTWDDCNALLSVRQWKRGAGQTRSLLGRAAGTLVEIAVDYYSQVPGVVDTNTTQGKLIKSFLESIDDIQFADGAPRVVGAQLVESLFVSTLEALRDHPELAIDSERGQEIIKTVTTDLVTRAQELVEQQPDQLGRDLVETWAKTLFPSLLRSSAAAVLADPRRFLGVKREDQAALVSSVGGALLTTLAAGGKGGLDRLFAPQTLDAIVQASLEMVARYPALVGAKQEFAARLVSETARVLHESAVPFGPDLLPELVRVVLEKSATHLDVLLPIDAAGDLRKHLLLTGLQTILVVISKQPPAGVKWKLEFTSVDALELAQTLVDEIVQNPGWLQQRTGDVQPLLGVVVGSTLDVLRSRAGTQLTRETGRAVILSVVRAVTTRLELGIKDPQGRMIATAVVGTVLDTIETSKVTGSARWILARDEAVRRLIDLVLGELVNSATVIDALKRVDTFLAQTVTKLDAGEAWTWVALAASLRNALAAN